MKVNCEFCGGEVERGSLACARCGSPLDKTTPAVEPEEAPPEAEVTDVSALVDLTVWPGTETEVTPG